VVISWAQQFVDHHFVEEPFKKRKRDRLNVIKSMKGLVILVSVKAAMCIYRLRRYVRGKSIERRQRVLVSLVGQEVECRTG
jgi:hypothetical protein